MHEMSVALLVVQRLQELDAHSDTNQLPNGPWEVFLHIPSSTCISPMALETSFELMSEIADPPLSHRCTLKCVEVPGFAECLTCLDDDGNKLRFHWDECGPSSCPTCGGVGRRSGIGPWIESIKSPSDC